MLSGKAAVKQPLEAIHLALEGSQLSPNLGEGGCRSIDRTFLISWEERGVGLELESATGDSALSGCQRERSWMVVIEVGQMRALADVEEGKELRSLQQNCNSG